MATKMYLPSTGTAPVTPSAWAGWSATAAGITRPFSITKGSTTMTTISAVDGITTGPTAMVRWVSPPLAAVTITGTWRYVARHATVQASGFVKGCAVLKVVSNDGTTVRGTLISRLSTSHTTNFNVSGALRNLMNPEWEGTIACTSVAASEGDRLVFEIGFYNQNASTDDFSFSCGEDSATDCVFDDAGTAANNPWMELSQTLTFNAESGGTKFYFPNTANTSGLTPTVHTNWDGGQAPTNFARYNLVTTKNNTALTNIATTVAAIVEECQLQFISLPIDAQTISGTVSLGIMQIVQTIGAVYFAYNIWVCTSAGAVRGVLLDRSANTGNAINSTLNYTHEYDGAVAISSVVCSAGDRVVVEIGYDVNNSTSKTMGCRLGDLTANSDISSDSSTTTNVNGIANFSFTIVFQSSSGGKNSLMMMGCGT